MFAISRLLLACHVIVSTETLELHFIFSLSVVFFVCSFFLVAFLYADVFLSCNAFDLSGLP